MVVAYGVHLHAPYSKRMTNFQAPYTARQPRCWHSPAPKRSFKDDSSDLLSSPISEELLSSRMPFPSFSITDYPLPSGNSMFLGNHSKFLRWCRTHTRDHWGSFECLDEIALRSVDISVHVLGNTLSLLGKSDAS